MSPLAELAANVGKWLLTKIQRHEAHRESPEGQLEELQSGVTAHDQEQVTTIWTRWRNRRRVPPPGDRLREPTETGDGA